MIVEQGCSALSMAVENFAGVSSRWHGKRRAHGVAK